MRRHLARHADAAVLADAHGAQRAARAEVRDVDAAFGQAGERDVAFDLDLLGFTGNAAQAERARRDSPRARRRHP